MSKGDQKHSGQPGSCWKYVRKSIFTGITELNRISDTAQDPTSSPDFDNFEYFAQSFELENVIEYQKVWYQNFSHIKLHQKIIT